MRLIDADVLKKYIDDCKCCEKCSMKMRNCNDDCELPDFLTKQWERVIDEQPTVDAVPVIRCKDCKHWNEYGYCTVNINFHYLTGDIDYCSAFLKGNKNETN